MALPTFAPSLKEEMQLPRSTTAHVLSDYLIFFLQQNFRYGLQTITELSVLFQSLRGDILRSKNSCPNCQILQLDVS